MARFDPNESYKRKGRTPKRKDSKRSGNRDSGRDRSRGRDSGHSRRGRSSRDQERTEVTCDSCKKRCEVPFKPSSNKPIYCSDCFKKDSGSKSSGKGLKEINEKLDKIIRALEID